jgi:Cu(I)/Ag(I) efflux system membrane protein CusA/SilA
VTLRRIARFAARRSWAILGAALVLLVLGEAARRSLAEDAIPDVADPHVSVVIEWSRHPAPEVAASATALLVDALAGVEGAQTVRGTSMTGLGYVSVVFPRMVELAPGRAAIEKRVAALAGRLPPDAVVRVGPDASSSGWVLEYALVAPSDESGHGDGTTGLSLLTLRRFQDDVVQPALRAVPGVAEVAAVGGEIGEVVVALKSDEMRAAGVAFSDVASTLGGHLALPEPAGPPPYDQIASIPLGAPASGRAPLLLGDLARVRLGREMSAAGMADINGAAPAVGGIVIARADSDPASVVASARRRLAELRAQLPQGVDLVVVYDRAKLAHRIARTLARALGEEAAVVVLVVLAFLLHGRSALVPLATLLLVLALTFLGMALAGIPSNVMSLGGIAIALGMAVDADIVALEACHRRLESAMGALTGARRRARLLVAANAFAPAIATSLVIAALAFVPALAFSGETGRLLRPLVLTKTLVVGSSALVAVLVGPALRDRLVEGRIRPEFGHPLTRSLVRLYRPIVQFALGRPMFTLAFVTLAAASSLPLLRNLGGEFFPPLEEGDLLYMPTTSPDVPGEVAYAELTQQDAVLARRPEVSLVFGKIGRADTATDPAPCSMAETLVALRPRDAWPQTVHPRWYSAFAPRWLAAALGTVWPERRAATTAELVADLDRATRRPGWTNAWTAPVRARMDMTSTGVRTPVGIRIVASDPSRLETLGEDVRAAALRTPGTRHASFESTGGETHLRFVPDAPALARHHVDAAVVQSTADLLLTGGVVGQALQGRYRVPVRLLPDVAPPPLDDLLRATTVRATAEGGGQPVPLALLGRPVFERLPAELRRERGRSVGYVYLDVQDGTDLLGYVDACRKEVQKAIAAPSSRLKPDEAIEWTGQYELLVAGWHRFRIIAPVVALLSLALLVLQFRSVVESLIVFCSVPFALVGSIWTLFLLGYPLSGPVWVGLLSVVGLATQTGVLMVVYLDEAFYRAVRQGRIASREDIVVAHAEGTIRRLRPKIMTVTTMGAALLPLLWSEGPGAEIMKRVAAPMLGGLVCSAFVTLEVIPVLQTLWRERQLRRACQMGVPLARIVGARDWSSCRR